MTGRPEVRLATPYRTRLILSHVRLLGIAAAVFGLLLATDRAPEVAAPVDRTLVVAVLRAPGAWLTGATRASAGFQDDLVAQYASARGLAIRVVDVQSADELAAKVTAGEAHIGVGDARVTRNLFAGFDVALAIAPPLDLAWAVSPHMRTLGDDVDRFLLAARADGVLARLAERYFGPRPRLEPSEAAAFRERTARVLPRYQRWFEEAAASSGVDWRVLAAIAYQESQWDPAATSPTGVRGFMQITEDTALRLGIDRLDPNASIHGAARYLAALKARLPARIAEPDRTLLALAAYNIGGGHLEDARVVAQRLKLDPDRWDDVRQALPLLVLPEHYESARNGYARGGMPVAFVDRVRAYHDLLVHHGPDSAPPLHVAENR
ncbi:MAG TPA: transglycosylase SLT domain-containing protein [Casimicrobiaceae bacterium]